jgi:MFS superfamily sulfate permease-like transporter
LVIRVESALFFANSDHVRDRIEALRTPSTRIVVVGRGNSPFIDISAAEMLALPDDRRGDQRRTEIPRDGPPAGPPG